MKKKYYNSVKKSNSAPIGSISVQVAPNRYGAAMTYNENTDTVAYYLNGKNPEAFMHKFNIKASCFNSENEDYEDYVNVHNYGLVSFNTVYFRSPEFGFTEEAVNRFRASVQLITGKIPSVASYRNGVTTGKEFMKDYFIGCRDSRFAYPSPSATINSEDAYTYYNFGNGLPSQVTTRDNTIVRPSTTRWIDAPSNLGITEAESSDWTIQEFQKTKTNRGFFNNFTHWHDFTPAKMDSYFSLMNSLISNTFIHSCGYDEAVEYMWHVYNIKSVSVINVGNGATINIVRENDLNIDTSLVYAPATIIVDLSDSILKNKNIGCNALGIRKISDNNYAIDIAYAQSQISIYEDNNYDYYDFTKPVALNIQYSSGIITFSTNVPCRKTMYITPTGGTLDEIEIVYRDSVLSLNHTINLNDSNVINYFESRNINDIESSDVYIGLITETKQTSLSDKIILV